MDATKMNLDQMMRQALNQSTQPAPNVPKLVKRDGDGQAVSKEEFDAKMSEEARKAVEYGLVRFNTIADERESLLRRVGELRNEITQLRAANEAGSAQLNEALSRLNSAMMTRDQCVADCAKYEVMFLSFRTQLETFLTPGVPLVRTNERPPQGPSAED
jgi:predicted  nucleic acid-binding Zn-ribbon protein